MRKKHGDLLALVVLVVCKYGGGRGGWTYTGRRELGTAYAGHTPAKLDRPWCVFLVLLSANHCLSRVFRLPGSESACFDRISFIHPRLCSLEIEIETGPLICRSSRTYHWQRLLGALLLTLGDNETTAFYVPCLKPTVELGKICRQGKVQSQ